jgi:hypothetical protein
MDEGSVHQEARAQNNTSRKDADFIDAQSGIRTHVPSAGAVGNSTHLRPLGHYDRHHIF